MDPEAFVRIKGVCQIQTQWPDGGQPANADPGTLLQFKITVVVKGVAGICKYGKAPVLTNEIIVFETACHKILAAEDFGNERDQLRNLFEQI